MKILERLKGAADPLRVAASMFGVPESLAPALQSLAEIFANANELGVASPPAWLIPILEDNATADCPPELIAAALVVMECNGNYMALLVGETAGAILAHVTPIVARYADSIKKLRGDGAELVPAVITIAGGDRRRAAEIATTYALYIARRAIVTTEN